MSQGHIPYSERSGRQPDFIVEYDIINDQIGRPTQGMRLDFMYEEDKLLMPNPPIYMIWPEILDEHGQVFLDNTVGGIPYHGRANMWIVNDDMRHFHAQRLQIGTRGFWFRGGFIATVTVIDLLHLGHANAEYASPSP